MKNKSRYFYLSNLIIFSLLGCKTQKSSTPNVIYIFPDQMRNHAMGFWREARFRDAVNFEGDPVQLPAEQSAPGNIVNGDVSGT